MPDEPQALALLRTASRRPARIAADGWIVERRCPPSS